MKVGVTSMTLLDSLALGNSPEAWDKFVDLYAPLMLHWNRQLGLQEADARDIAQDAMAFIITNIKKFTRAREGSFRLWLKRINYNMLRNFRKKKLGQPNSSDLDYENLQNAGDDFLFAENYYQDVFESALRLLHRDFTELTWNAFLATVLLNRPIEEVGAELKQSPNAVYIARHRIINRLSEAVQEFVEGDDLPLLTVEMAERITSQAAKSLRNRMEPDSGTNT